ncbi:unnamed protein product, partial [Musa textilis]
EIVLFSSPFRVSFSCSACSRPSRLHRDGCRPSPPLHRTRVPLSIDPDDIVAEDEILSILYVPPGKIGRVITRKEAFIRSVKEACKYAFHLYIQI